MPNGRRPWEMCQEERLRHVQRDLRTSPEHRPVSADRIGRLQQERKVTLGERLDAGLRRVHAHVERGDDVAGVVPYRRGDRADTGGQLFIDLLPEMASRQN